MLRSGFVPGAGCVVSRSRGTMTDVSSDSRTTIIPMIMPRTMTAAGRTEPVGVDALLLVSFGGPEAPSDVMPFLRNVTHGRGVPDERLAQVAEQYRRLGGRSPINDQNRALLAALRAELAPLPVYWGNRNWSPFLVDALRAMRRDGVGRAACFVTSAFASYSGCRQYREDLARARAQLGPGAPELIKLRQYFDHPGFVLPMVDHVVDELATIPAASLARTRLVFVAHSIPLTQSADSGPDGDAYPRQLAAAAAVIVERVALRTGRRHPHDLVYASRSGPPSVPWLAPDVGDHLAALGSAGRTQAVVVVPIGFVSDHMEVIHDLDVMAAERARAVGLSFRRASTVGADPRFVTMVRELLDERRYGHRPRAALSPLGPGHDVCPLWCCAPRGPGRRLPAAAGVPADERPGQDTAGHRPDAPDSDVPDSDAPDGTAPGGDAPGSGPAPLETSDGAHRDICDVHDVGGGATVHNDVHKVGRP
ncbi:Ferrochelatase [Candidatus Protofrankia datiscae]|uniref:Coproporphyrin III ferrochelatase n=2 Tax=Frankiaceae TaxID=74712 RepID=F8B5N8_9ACTN|nr:Ferrochelatase [Candidatus Protofrankia datiscae]